MEAGPRRIDLAKIMTMSPNTPDLDALLAHSGWVRALAQNLVSDPATADDVAQQAWQAALERPPRHGSNLRSWWSSVVRSSAGKGWREQASRQRLERKLQTREPSRAADRPEELAERLDTFQRLASAVAQLPEPYGSAIYLRFFEELSVKEVAKRQGLPLATAQSHITRGLERLRGALQKDLGEEWRHRCWLFAVPMQAAPWLSLGPLTILAMNTKTTLSLAAGLLALLTLFLWNPWAAEDLEQDQNQLAAGTFEVEGGSSQATIPEAGALNAAGLVREDIPLVPAPVVGGKVAVHIRDAVTLEAVPNAQVHYLPYSTWKEPEVERIMREEKPGPYERITRFGEPFQADASGVLQLPAPDQRFSIVAENGESFGYRWFFDPAEVSQGFEILLYPEIQVTVEVRDGSGNPVKGAAVGFNHAPFAYTNSPSLQVATDADGKATFTHLELETSDHPERPGSFALLVPSAPAQRFEVAAADLPGAHIQFVMPQTGTVQIEAVDGSGFPLDNGTPVVLQLADQIARTVANGGSQEARNRFSMKLSESMQVAYVREGIATFTQVGIGTELAAASYDDEANGYAVAIVQGPRHAGDVVKATLGLSKAPGELRFRLVNADGEQIALLPGHSVILSGVDQEGSGFGHGDTPQLLKDGTYRIPLVERELQAQELWISTSPPWGQASSELRFGVLRIEMDRVRQAGFVHEIPFATELLLNATVVNREGQVQADAPLRWVLSPDKAGHGNGSLTPGGTRLYERWEDMQSSEQGSVKIFGPPAPHGCHYLLKEGGERVSYHVPSEAIPFELGAASQFVVLPTANALQGIVLVDDLGMQQHIQVHYGVGQWGEPGYVSIPLELEFPNGRYTVPAKTIGEGPISVVVECQYTEEVLGQLNNVVSLVQEQDSNRVLPALDLRGKLFRHKVIATSESGVSIADLRIRASSTRWKAAPPDAEFLSTNSVLSLEIGAAGFLTQKVFLQGETSVILEKAPQWTIRSNVTLPEHPNVDWTLHLLPTTHEGSIMLGGEGRQALDFQNGEASFALPKEGEWALGLQATIKGSEHIAPFAGAYLFPSGSPFEIVAFESQAGNEHVQPFAPDALRAALDEALAEAGLSEN